MKTPSLVAHLKSILLLPFVVTVLVPFVLQVYIPPLSNDPLGKTTSALSFGLGIPLMAFGLFFLLRSIILFNNIGRGTLAPWNPTRKMVVKGLYRHVRNPMIVGVLLILIGESIVFKSTLVLLWTLLFFIINHVYFIIREEPEMQKRFGNEYSEYRKNVRRWIPRIRGWRPENAKVPDTK